MAYELKPFYLNANDVAYLLKQVNFVPLFDAQGNAVVDWDGLSPVTDAKGNAIVLTGLTQAQAWATYGHGFPQVSAPVGIRDVTGYHNNLFGTQAEWGNADVPFRRDIAADFNNYTTSHSADLSVTLDSTNHVIVHDLVGAAADLTFDFSSDVATAIGTNGTSVASIALNPAGTAIVISFTDLSTLTPVTVDLTASLVLDSTSTTTYVNAVNNHNTLTETANHVTTTASHTGTTASVLIDYNTTVDAFGVVHQGNVTDSTPRIITRTITTGGINLLLDANNHFVAWDHLKYEAASVPLPVGATQAEIDAHAAAVAYKALLDAHGVAPVPVVGYPGEYANLVDGAKIVDPSGMSIAWDPSAYNASAVYKYALAIYAANQVLAAGGSDLKLYGSAAGGALTDGGNVFIHTGATYAPVAIGGVPVQFDANLYLYKGLIDATGTATGSLATGDLIDVTGADISSLASGIAATASLSSGIINSLVSADPGYGLLQQLGHIDFQNPTSGEYFIGSENPGVAPVNSWFGIFGQFFDHGLDFIGKGAQGTTISIALETTDPLYRAPGTNGSTDPGYTAIVISRANVAGADANGDPTYVNHTSPFIDQSQTYGSSDQITQLLREWVDPDGNGVYQAGMNLFDGSKLVDAWERRWPDGTTTMVHDTLPTLNELRAHVLATGRDALTWEDVFDFRNRDATGHLSGGNSGHALILDMNPHFDVMQPGGTGHITAASIAELDAALGNAVGTTTTANFNIGMIMGYLNPDFSIKSTVTPEIHNAVSDILMDTVGDHYIAGDGRVNENFGLTSIHHVFHEEHNYQVENLKNWIYQHDAHSGTTDHAALHEWQDATAFQDDFGNYMFNATATHQVEVSPGVFKTQANDDNVAWNADKMFNGTKLIVEMEYQHAAVDQYARTVTPRIQEFVGYSTGVDSTISLEYAQVAFRFGHSTIRETIDAIDPNGWMLGHVTKYALEKAFLAPQTFAQEGIAAITLGLSRQQMNEVDEFVTPALNQGLLGQPLDLAAINIARGRDLGIPTLNDFREGISLARYTSWDDFGKNMIHPESLVNFIAAYSFGGDAAKAQAIMGLYDGSIVEGSTAASGFTAADAVAFMLNNATANTELNTARDGFNHIDSWIGGLAEAHVPGGLLGETFDAVFVAQIQSLMDGDRFYYLYRLFGTNIHEEVNNGQFKDIVERNTGLSHLNGSIFAYADKYYDFGREADGTEYTIQDSSPVMLDENGVPLVDGSGATISNPGYHVNRTGDHANHLYADMITTGGKGIFSDGGVSTDPNGDIITVTGSDFVRAAVTQEYIRDVRVDAHPDQVHPVEGTPTDGADSHEVIVATDNADFIHARAGDDTVYGEGGNDYIFGDGGIDRLYGGAGDDMLDTGEGPDLADGGAGKDIIYGRGSGSEVGGFDQLVGGSGNDLIIGGEGIDKLSGGSGDDIIYGDGLTNPEMGNTDPFTHGGDGNDYMDGGASGDLLFGEEGDDYIVGGIDQDLIQGGQGDDIIRPGGPSQASGTNGGPDEVVGDDGINNVGFDLIDLSDWAGNAPGATIDFATQNNPLVAIDATAPFPAWFQMEGAIGTKNSDTFIGADALDAAGVANLSGGGNWLIGGSGNDSFQGKGGNDVIVGGSIRLDTLIGKYADAANASGPTGALGSVGWLADAMQSGGNGTGYNDNTENSYTGASNRATGTLSGGLLTGVNAMIAGTANDYDLHFTEMLKSRMFKDVVLGDGDGAAVGLGGDSGAADVAVFGGKFSQYSMVAYDISGAVITAPHINWGSVYAIRVTDNRTAADLLDANGAPLVDANGDPLTLDGSDLVIGIENFQFSDMTVKAGAFFDAAPVLDLDYLGVPSTIQVATDNFSSGTYAGGSGWTTTNWTEEGDGANNSTTGAITITGGGNQRLEFHNSATASISRGVSLAGLTAADTPKLSFDLSKNGIGAGETLLVQYSSNGNTWVTVATYGNGSNSTNNGTGAQTIDLSAQTLTANSAIRFVSGSYGNAGDYFRIDNVAVSKAGPATDGHAGVNFSTSYTEGGAAAAIATSALITDADTTDMIVSAKIVLTDAIAGDVLAVGTLPPGVTSSVNGTTITLTGAASRSDYQAALQAITFSNTGDDPTNHGSSPTRHIDVTVNDGFRDSAVATTTVNVTGVDDAASALAADNVITNIAVGNTNITIPTWALVANDTDVDGAVITSLANVAGMQVSGNGTGLSGGNAVVRDTTTLGSTFSYTVANAIPANQSATVTVTHDTAGALDGNNNDNIIIGDGADTTINANGGNDIVLAGAGNDTVNGGAGNDTLHGQTGDDTINAGDGDDIVVWTAANGGGGGGGTTDGTDVVDGGNSTAGIGDRFVLNGNNSAETFRILSILDPNNDAEINTLLNALNGGQGYALNPASTILITRTTTGGGGGTTIVAELRNVEEITINTQAITTGGGNTAGQGADTVQIVGDFTGTGLALNTITINGSDGEDIVDISGLTSEHRIVFNSGGGNDHVVGDLRPQDVVNFGSNGSGGTSPVAGSTSGEGTGSTGNTGGQSGEDDDDNDVSAGAGSGNGNAGNTAAAADQTLIGDDNANVLTGDSGNDVALGNGGADTLSGGSGDDFINAGAGNDTVFAGVGNDSIYGEDGNDMILAGAGNDMINAGNGDDDAFGGAGDDTFITRAGDGSDSYYGDAGVDTLDMSAISANIEANLGTGLAGYAKVAGGPQDQLYGIENIVTGSGNDKVIASAAHNVIDTGAGSDTVVFKSASDADGDRILNFEAGDKIDVSAFMGGSISLVNGNTASAGQIAVHFENIGGENFTVLDGTAASGDHFKVELKGHHDMQASDFAA